mmetsp:Transcript_9696/g.19461  ORF Transcript_9696/g.19461 Transcript_9696/m.19461 type:complete len:127 (-) Transcript_9696:40-420(-)
MVNSRAVLMVKVVDAYVRYLYRLPLGFRNYQRYLVVILEVFRLFATILVMGDGKNKSKSNTITVPFYIAENPFRFFFSCHAQVQRWHTQYVPVRTSMLKKKVPTKLFSRECNFSSTYSQQPEGAQT